MRCHIGGIDLNGLFSHVPSHGVTDLCFRECRSLLRFCPTMSEALKR
jgi:hypothetical protein